MKLTIFAATGRIGRHLVEQGLEAGHDITAVVRNPGKLTRDVPTITADLIRADPLILRSAVAGADGVLSAFGPSSRAQTGITSAGTEAIVQAMQSAGTRRIVVVSAAPVSTTPSPGRPNAPKHDPGEGPLMRYVGGPMSRLFLGRHFADLALMEDILRASGLDWTSIRPPRLTDKPLSGTYRTAVDQNLRGGLYASRADVAHLMLHALDDHTTIKQAIGIAT